jgi:hypothetical protein
MASGRDRDRVHFRSERARVIDAPPEAVWPWLVQMGFDRGGWYAIDALEKLFGVGRFATGRSARRIEPTLQQLVVGDRIPLTRSRWLVVAVLDAPSELTLVLPPGLLTWLWSFRLAPVVGGRSRLTITTELSIRSTGGIRQLLARGAFRIFDVGHGIMERVQLRTLARRAPAAGSGPAGQ